MIQNQAAYEDSEDQKKLVLDYLEEPGNEVDREELSPREQTLRGDGGVKGMRLEFKLASKDNPDSVSITCEQLRDFDPRGYFVCSPRKTDGSVDLENTLVFNRKFVDAYLNITYAYRERKIYNGHKEFRVFLFRLQAHNAYTLKTFRDVL